MQSVKVTNRSFLVICTFHYPLLLLQDSVHGKNDGRTPQCDKRSGDPNADPDHEAIESECLFLKKKIGYIFRAVLDSQQNWVENRILIGPLAPSHVHICIHVYICMQTKLLQFCPALYDPMDCSLSGSSVMEFSRQEYWSGLPFPPPGDLPDPGIEPMCLMSPVLAGGFFTTSTIWEAYLHQYIPPEWYIRYGQ